MKQSTPGDGVLSALGAVIVVALVVMLGAIAYAMTGVSDDATNRVAAVTSAATAPANGRTNKAVIAQMSRPSPTPTPTPMPIGVDCKAEDLTGVHKFDGGAGAFRLMYIELLNTSDRPCDLPIISSIEALDAAGSLITRENVIPGGCFASFCISTGALPLDPLVLASPDSIFDRGSVGAILEHSRCDGGTDFCTQHGSAASYIVFNFTNDTTLRVPIEKPVTLNANYLSLWSLNLVD